MSSCELPQPGHAASGKPDSARSARVTAAGSRVHRFTPGNVNAWSGVPLQDYKAAATHHCGVTRSVLVGEHGERTSFHVRYFEIEPGGFTTRERHVHEHVVFVLRGSGVALLGDTEHELRFGDTLYIAPNEVHQLRNTSTEESFGFLCMVDAVRDVPIPVNR
ncbi:MAG: cupin domain-containing protein [Planctomycetia bacterium]|nr:cupin domain-containing protein [Planctomycetia bacterium]